jgi:hypothetical protein
LLLLTDFDEEVVRVLGSGWEGRAEVEEVGSRGAEGSFKGGGGGEPEVDMVVERGFLSC